MCIVEIETERLILRTWQISDRAEFARLNSDFRVMEFMSACLSPAESDLFLDRILEHFRNHGFGLWAVELREERRFIGALGLSLVSFTAPANLRSRRVMEKIGNDSRFIGRLRTSKPAGGSSAAAARRVLPEPKQLAARSAIVNPRRCAVDFNLNCRRIHSRAALTSLRGGCYVKKLHWDQSTQCVAVLSVSAIEA